MDLVKIASLHTGSCARPRAPSEPELALGRIGERGLVSAPCGGVRDDSENGPRVPRGPPPTHESTQRPPCRLLAQVVSDRAVPAAPAPRNTGRMLRPTGVRSAHPWRNVETCPQVIFPAAWEIGRHAVLPGAASPLKCSRFHGRNLGVSVTAKEAQEARGPLRPPAGSYGAKNFTPVAPKQERVAASAREASAALP